MSVGFFEVACVGCKVLWFMGASITKGQPAQLSISASQKSTWKERIVDFCSYKIIADTLTVIISIAADFKISMQTSRTEQWDRLQDSVDELQTMKGSTSPCTSIDAVS